MAQRRAREESGHEPRVPGTPPRVIGVGASAGGLEALQEFLGALTPDVGAIVVAQHLAPDHDSLMVELLSRSTPLTVIEAVDGTRLVAGEVVVSPPAHDITVVGDRIRLVAPPERTGPSPSIDLLFASLAREWGDRALAVVLSGTGTDGAQGLRAVHGAGGLTMVQSPESAGFDGMPRAAIALGGVDLVDDAATLGKRLGELPHGLSDWIGEAAGAIVPDVLPTIIGQLRRAIGIDFSQYKETTLLRQVQRRMVIRQVSDVPGYLEALATDPDEAHALAANLLVTVTSFFRDPDAFAALRAELETYLAVSPGDEPLRLWVPGCATGEEVYSLAMLVADILGRPADLARRLKIFGTDLDETSLAFARRALYPAAAAEAIPEELRDAFVRVDPDGMRIRDLLRDCVVFARHDVGGDPPFPRIDLVSCRNILIYFTPALQQRVLGLLQYSLRPGGLLFLGSAETVDRKDPGFTAASAEQRIFVRTAVPAHRVLPRVPLAGADTRPFVPASRPSAGSDPDSEGQLALLEAIVGLTGQAFLILDDDQRLTRVIGDVSAYCRMPDGQLTGSVGSFLRRELKDEARAVLLLCRADDAPVTGQPVLLEDAGVTVRLQATRLPVGEGAVTVLGFLTEADHAAADEAPADRGALFDKELERLERDLVASQEALRRSLTEVQAVNQELEASSEELQAATEELQAANEELQASNEELQASNEELGTLNQESRQRGDRLQAVNTDLENVQASLSQGMVIVNTRLEVTRFTPLAVRVFAFLDTDLGRPVLAIPMTTTIPGLESALREVLGGAPRRTIETSGSSPAYLVQVLPYLGSDGTCLGAIITLTDVSEMVALRATAEGVLSDLQEKSELLAHQAAYDSVTGLLNRRFFATAVETELIRARRTGTQVALAWLDLDRFKEVNDEFGHESGDVTLRTVADRITDLLRATDVVGRLGGDEIGILISTFGTHDDLDAALDRVLDGIRLPIVLGDNEARVTGSIGVAIFPQDGPTAKDLLRASDAAMYDIKRRAGDGFAYFDPTMNQATGERRLLRQEIADAIAAEDFELHYQPIVDAASDEVWGVEALVRWSRAGSLVTAGEFIPFCEQSGQIRPLGLLTIALLRKDLALLREHRAKGLKVAVNMSVSQLEDRHLDAIIAQSSAPGGLDGLVIEILESVFLPDHQQALAVLDRLTAQGAETSIDDYGAGYSNVRLLEALAPAYLKLDRSFLSEHHSREARSALVRSAVEIAHVIGARVVAEGIEEDDERALALDAGVDLAQGFGIARPMPLVDLLVWLDRASSAPAA